MPLGFDEERAYFEEHRTELCGRATGKYVLLKGSKEYGFFDTPRSAYKRGIELFGLEPFVFKQVLPDEEVLQMPAYYLGLLNARL